MGLCSRPHSDNDYPQLLLQALTLLHAALAALVNQELNVVRLREI